MIAALLLLAAAAAAGADWPRFESAAIIGKRELLAIHIPKAGGTSFFRALELARCETASWTRRGTERLLPTCRAFCDQYYHTNETLEKTTRLEGRRTASCLARKGTHVAQLHRCHSAYGLGEVFRDYQPIARPFHQPLENDKQLAARLAYARATEVPAINRNCPGGDGVSPRDCVLCATFLRRPWDRLVSAWFFPHHSPPAMPYEVGWPPWDGFVDGPGLAPTTRKPVSRTRLTGFRFRGDSYTWDGGRVGVEDYVRANAAVNVATRMLGMNSGAFTGADVPDAPALRRAVAVLKRVPFGLLEDARNSYLLLAHALSASPETCLKLFDIFRGAFESGDRRADARLSPRKLRWKAEMAANVTLRRHFEGYNALDLRLYDAAIEIWCEEFRVALDARDSCVGAVAGLSVPALCSRKID